MIWTSCSKASDAIPIHVQYIRGCSGLVSKYTSIETLQDACGRAVIFWGIWGARMVITRGFK